MASKADLNSIASKVDLMASKADLDSLKMEMASKADLDELRVGMTNLASSKELRSAFKEIRAGLGTSMEMTSSIWLKKLLMARGYADVKVTRNYVYFDKESNEFEEIDVISFSPLYILECTGFLKATEIRKLKRLVETKISAENHLGTKCEGLFFVAYGIHDSIKEEAKKIMDDNGITYIYDLDK